MGEVAERIGLVARCVDDETVYATALEVACKLVAGSPTTLQWTKRALNNWLKLSGPSFDASLALEFLGFRLPDIRQGLATVAGSMGRCNTLCGNVDFKG
jgi:enoyl-CoA hydratase